MVRLCLESDEMEGKEEKGRGVEWMEILDGIYNQQNL